MAESLQDMVDRGALTEECANRIAAESFAALLQPARQHVSDGAWEAHCKVHAGSAQLRGLSETYCADRGVILVTVEEWDRRATVADVKKTGDLERLQEQLAERDAEIERWKADRVEFIEWYRAEYDRLKNVIERLANAAGKRTELRRGRSSLRAEESRGTSPTAAASVHAALLTTPNLTDPRFGRK